MSLARHNRQNNQKYQKKVLEDMMAIRCNKKCADCETRGPRWCSYNLGCFICIRCSGIHRKMGTHISKVRSTSLDTWTIDQLDSFKELGNDKCNFHYMAKAPRDLTIPTGNDMRMERFIRDKYEHKKWYSSKGKKKKKSSSSRSLNSSKDGSSSSSSNSSKGSRDRKADKRVVIPVAQPPVVNNQPLIQLGTPTGSPTPTHNPAPVAVNAQQQQNQFFDSMFATTPKPIPAAATPPPIRQQQMFIPQQQQQQQMFTQQQQQQHVQQQQFGYPQVQQQQAMSKDALLSLYQQQPTVQPVVGQQMPFMGAGVQVQPTPVATGGTFGGTGYTGAPNYNVNLGGGVQPQQQSQPQQYGYGGYPAGGY